MAYSIPVPVNAPWEIIDWAMICDYSEKHEYNILDRMYVVIDEGRDEDNEFEDYTQEELKAEYSKRFPTMFADALIAMANDIKSRKLILDIKY